MRMPTIHSLSPSPQASFAWGALDSDLLGRLYVAATDQGVTHASYAAANEAAFLYEVANDLGGGAGVWNPMHPVIAQAQAELGAYLAGTGRVFTVPVDLRHLPGGFLRQVLETL